jgi:uncharacterized membrane protein YhaH (DUF805 family)
MKSYFETVMYVLSNMFNFDGKTGRKEYWIYFSFMFMVSFFFGIICVWVEYENQTIFRIYDVLVDASFLALVVRRLRDAGMIVWLGAVAFLPIVAIPGMIIIGLLSPEKYDYGPTPSL